MYTPNKSKQCTAQHKQLATTEYLTWFIRKCLFHFCIY